MSKVICDVCGTTYPDTATQCPICGSAKATAVQTGAGSAASGEYTYVKGGRFSKRNVRKRNKGVSTAQRRSAPAPRPASNGGGKSSNETSSNKGLVAVIILLLIAIVAVMIYIGVRFFFNREPAQTDPSTGSTGTSQVQPSTPPATESNPVRIPCTGVQTLTVIQLTEIGETWKLDVQLSPVDTTDKLMFGTSDSTVAVVDQNGVVTAVGDGTAEITVICGDAIATCVVHCTIPESTVPPTVQPFVMEFNTRFSDSTTGLPEVSLSKKGETWKAYKSGMTADPAEVTWITDNPEVCTVENGIVTAVGRGMTKIHAQFNGTTFTCIVRSNVPAQSEPTQPSGSCKISHTDVTIAVGESFKLTLKDADGKVLKVKWEANDVNVTIDGNKITGAKSGRVIVSTTYEDVKYSCIIYVK